MANPLEAMLRGLSGGHRGIGNINYMKPVGGISGGGVRANAGAAPQARSPNSGDLMTDPRSALSVGDEWLKGNLKEWFPTPQEKQARTNADLFAQALVGSEGQQGLLGQNITPELIAQAAGQMRKGGADAEGLLGFAQWAAPAMQAQREQEWKQAKAELDMKRLEALIRNADARTANTQAAGARAAAKAAGGGGKGAIDDIF